MTHRRRALVLTLLVLGLALVCVSGAALFRRAGTHVEENASDLLIRAARSQMQATERLLEAVDDINRRLMVLEKMVFSEEARASVEGPGPGAGVPLAQQVRELQRAQDALRSLSGSAGAGTPPIPAKPQVRGAAEAGRS